MSNQTQTYIPQLRAEKTTKNRDDLRVMIAGTLFCIFLIVVQPFVFRIHDHFIAERPFVSALVQVYYIEGRNRPMILYDADATQSVKGEWRATLHSKKESGARIATRRGIGSYTNLEDVGKLWTWGAWFENDSELGPPSVPNEIFKACVHYEVETQDSGTYDESEEPFCSDWYDPNNPTLPPEVFPTLGE